MAREGKGLTPWVTMRIPLDHPERLFVLLCLVITVFLLSPAASTAQEMEEGARFRSSDSALSKGFDWATGQALAYVRRSGDRVGPWYEAALPKRDAFCMRDVSHQLLGADILGLAGINRNLLRKFAASISDTRDWCGYWEIDKEDRPAPVDYKNDREFWYNLPANFDILNACYRQYLWTGDTVYLRDPVFLNYYKRTVDDYVRRWDRDNDGLMEGSPDSLSSRGLSSYDEEKTGRIGSDLVAGEFLGYSNYAAILSLLRQDSASGLYREKAASIAERFNSSWWDTSGKSYYHYIRYDGSWLKNDQMQVFLLRWGIVPKDRAPLVLRSIMEALDSIGVEVFSYIPEEIYRYGDPRDAEKELKRLVSSDLKRREYPEVSFAALGTYARGLMGIEADAPQSTIRTLSRLTGNGTWAELDRIPIFSNRVRIRHDGMRRTTFTNISGRSVTWEASFYSASRALRVNGSVRKGQILTDTNGRSIVSYRERVAPGKRCEIRTD